jgi:hypothetical protein
MKLFELEEADLDTAVYDPSKDKATARELGDTRKARVTLRKINRLKKMRALKQLEKLKRQDLLAVMYGTPEGDEGGMGGGMGGF